MAQALRAYTHEVAWMSFDEQERGTLEQGKIADMAVISGNPLDTSLADLSGLQTEQLPDGEIALWTAPLRRPASRRRRTCRTREPPTG